MGDLGKLGDVFNDEVILVVFDGLEALELGVLGLVVHELLRLILILLEQLYRQLFNFVIFGLVFLELFVKISFILLQTLNFNQLFFDFLVLIRLN